MTRRINQFHHQIDEEVFSGIRGCMYDSSPVVGATARPCIPVAVPLAMLAVVSAPDSRASGVFLSGCRWLRVLHCRPSTVLAALSIVRS